MATKARKEFERMVHERYHRAVRKYNRHKQQERHNGEVQRAIQDIKDSMREREEEAQIGQRVSVEEGGRANDGEGDPRGPNRESGILQ